jgi:hypothetical protein
MLGSDGRGSKIFAAEHVSFRLKRSKEALGRFFAQGLVEWCAVVESVTAVANAEPVIRASYVNDSIHLRERAAEMRVSSKELKDNNAAAAIMRLADLYDRLADRAEARSDRALQSDGERG